MTPYTYLIGWSKHSKYYYGVRYASDCGPSDLWVSYFTSSKYVKQFREENGEPNIIQIRKTFNNINDARNWEHKVLRRMNIIYNDKFLNKTDNHSIDPKYAVHRGPAHWLFGKKLTDEQKAHLKLPKSEKAKQNMRGPRPHVNQTGKNNNAFKGYVYTPYGVFESMKAAGIVEGVDSSTICYRIRKGFPNYRRAA